jgi:pimeloyl-ACP methyl ester carboxylesterase
MSYADVNGLHLYFEEHGSGGTPLVLLHGGLSAGEVLAPLTAELAAGRRVIVPDLQGHGRTADVDRPLRPELMADDVAALVEHLGLARVDLAGYSLGGEVALRGAIQHPSVVRRLVLVSVPFARAGQHPEVLEAMDAMTPAIAEAMRQASIYALYERIAPNPDDWVTLVAKTSELLKVDYDWRTETGALAARTMLVFADADSIRPAHVVEFFALLGGGLRDAGVDGSARPAARLAVLPGTTHYDITESPLLAPAVAPFLDAPA